MILKFGGTSVGSAERMRSLVPLVAGNQPRVVVLSAMSGTTNVLVEIASALYQKDSARASELIRQLEAKYTAEVQDLYQQPASLSKGLHLIRYHMDYLRSFTLDMFTANEEKAVLAQGELLSTAMFHYYLQEIGVESVLLQALNFMRIDEHQEPDMGFIRANIHVEMGQYPEAKLFITQGFICRNAFGEIDNLKRGGSDYTASLIGAALDADEVQIWTDIDGMHNNDPREVSPTHAIHELSFDEAAELAYFGAKILHPTCILPAQKQKIPVRLLNTLEPAAQGTTIQTTSGSGGIKAVAAKDGITAIKIKSGRMLLAYGFLRSVFEVFERHKTSIDMITTSEVVVSLTIDQSQNLQDIVRELEAFGTVEVDRDQTIICVVGDFSGQQKGYASQVFEALKNIPIRMISYGGSRHNVSVLVSSDQKKEALQALNKGLFNYS